MRKPLICAHRGASSLARENTLASYAKAIEIGADMIEFDVRRTKDRVLVAFHDRAIDGHHIEDLTFEEANSFARVKGFVIPRLEEVLQFTHGRIKLDVELKETGYEADVVAMLLQYLDRDEFVITSFRDITVKIIKERFPELRVGLLLGYGQPDRSLWLSYSDLFPMARCRRCHADFFAAHFRLLRLGFLKRAAQNRKPVIVWTVDDPIAIEKLLAEGRVETVISNKPDLAISIYDNLRLTEERQAGSALSR